MESERRVVNKISIKYKIVFLLYRYEFKFKVNLPQSHEDLHEDLYFDKKYSQRSAVYPVRYIY